MNILKLNRLIRLALCLTVLLVAGCKGSSVATRSIKCDDGFSTPKGATQATISERFPSVHWYDEDGFNRRITPHGTVCRYSN